MQSATTEIEAVEPAREEGLPDRTDSPEASDAIGLRDEERTRCEVWTRVMGYHRPVSAWNPGKRSEYADRVHYVEPSDR